MEATATRWALGNDLRKQLAELANTNAGSAPTSLGLADPFSNSLFL